MVLTGAPMRRGPLTPRSRMYKVEIIYGLQFVIDGPIVRQQPVDEKGVRNLGVRCFLPRRKMPRPFQDHRCS